jgi:hypothetical protein
MAHLERACNIRSSMIGMGNFHYKRLELYNIPSGNKFLALARYTPFGHSRNAT